MSSPSNPNAVIGEEIVAGATTVDIFDANGNKIKFGSLFEFQRTIVVFIRHFFCGRCQTPNSYISIYAEPSRTLYRAMGMTVESLSKPPPGEAKKSYVSGGNIMNALISTLKALKHPSHVGKQGNISQLGGEFILGPNTEVSELLRNAGVPVL
ncbi:hypothetical protein Clacol_004629 [Clathrus columnatus]|uniref:Uncharacterized protein n=1 Tax=Clathrus columnatus TaxID=1419009 RepID=A0AAV5AB52_9AGAM|nr:hypothetical protein Clacol_004629 [Clathrus columnatus]